MNASEPTRPIWLEGTRVSAAVVIAPLPCMRNADLSNPTTRLRSRRFVLRAARPEANTGAAGLAEGELAARHPGPRRGSQIVKSVLG